MKKEHTRKVSRPQVDLALEELRAWLENNDAIWLAKKLGYKAPETVKAWVRRKSIPSFQKYRVLSAIRRNPDTKNKEN